MRRNFILVVFLGLFLVACTAKTEPLPTTSIRFTPLNFPHSHLGEFILTDNLNPEQLQLFLTVFSNTFSFSQIDDHVVLQDLPNTFSLQLFSEKTLTDIYRLSFDFEKDIAFLQNQQHIYAVSQSDFHQIIETGYFNVIFKKNYAPTAEFLLNNIDVKYSVNGTWNYETYQNNFLSYKINKEQEQSTNYIVTDSEFILTYRFPEKQPDEIYESIRSAENMIENRRQLTSEQISIPVGEGNYYYEIEAIWSNPALPYKATLKYQFQLEVNYPPKVKVESFANSGMVAAISVENYDPNGRVTVASDLWEKEIPLTLINQKYYGLLPIPIDSEAGEYEIHIIGSNSSETLRQKENLNVSANKISALAVGKKQFEKYIIEQSQDEYYQQLIQTKNLSSADEKLWTGNFLFPTAAPGTAVYGQIYTYRDLRYQYQRIPYSANGNFDIYSPANGIVRVVNHNPELGYSLIIDHGLGLFSLLGGMSEVLIKPGSYIFAKQKIGSSDRTDILPNPAFTYATIVHGYYVNPNSFWERDPISLFK